MRIVMIFVGGCVALAVLAATVPVYAEMLCRKRNSACVVRDAACRAKETAVTLSPEMLPPDAPDEPGEPPDAEPPRIYAANVDGSAPPFGENTPMVTVRVPAGAYLTTAMLNVDGGPLPCKLGRVCANGMSACSTEVTATAPADSVDYGLTMAAIVTMAEAGTLGVWCVAPTIPGSVASPSEPKLLALPVTP